MSERRFVVAIDFDGVLCREAWPGIGEEMPGALDFLRWLDENDFDRVLWTCRSYHEDSLPEFEAMMIWLGERGFGHGSGWAGINRNTDSMVEEYGSRPRKVGYDAIIDDKAVDLWSPTVFEADAKTAVPAWLGIQKSLLRRREAWLAKRRA